MRAKNRPVCSRTCATRSSSNDCRPSCAGSRLDPRQFGLDLHATFRTIARFRSIQRTSEGAESAPRGQRATYVQIPFDACARGRGCDRKHSGRPIFQVDEIREGAESSDGERSLASEPAPLEGSTDRDGPQRDRAPYKAASRQVEASHSDRGDRRAQRVSSRELGSLSRSPSSDLRALSGPGGRSLRPQFAVRTMRHSAGSCAIVKGGFGRPGGPGLGCRIASENQ